MNMGAFPSGQWEMCIRDRQGLSVDAALFLFDPNGRLILVCLLDEEGGRTSVQTYLIPVSYTHLYVPQRGDVAKLVTMAYTNAVERLGRESGRYTREEKIGRASCRERV